MSEPHDSPTRAGGPDPWGAGSADPSAPTRLPWRWGAPAPVGPRPPGADPGSRPAIRTVRCPADPARLWLWLSQLRRAPYSDDLLDNLGRRSPRTPDPSLTALRTGQRVMTIFDVVGVQAGRELHLRMRPGAPTLLFGALDVVYRIEVEEPPSAPGGPACMLSAVLWMPPLPGPGGAARRLLLAWGDVLMKR